MCDNGNDKSKQLCWDCKRAIGGENGCSWSTTFMPVKGWTATPNTIRYYDGIVTETYDITQCPLFVKDDKRPYTLNALYTLAARALGLSVMYVNNLVKKRPDYIRERLCDIDREDIWEDIQMMLSDIYDDNDQE